MKRSLVFGQFFIDFESSESHVRPEDNLYGPGQASQLVEVTVPLDSEGLPVWSRADAEFIGEAHGYYANHEGKDDFAVDFEPTGPEASLIKGLALLEARGRYDGPNSEYYFNVKETT